MVGKLDKNFRMWTWRLCGAVIFLVSSILFIVLWEPELGTVLILASLFATNIEVTEESITFVYYSYLFVIFILIIVAGRCFKRAKKIVALSLEQKLSEDNRLPVVYLRSFKKDRAAARMTSLTFRGLATEEEQLAEVFNKLGPLVAIGAPGEKLPQLGAARGYFNGNDWKDHIRSMMKKSRLLIFRAGDTEGFWWEVAEAVKIVSPEKMLFLIPFSKKKYELFRQSAEEYLPCSLPGYVGRKVSDEAIRAVLYFDKDWTPHIRSMQASSLAYWLKVVFRPFVTIITLVTFFRKKPLVRILEKTLEPVFEQVTELSGAKTSNSQGAKPPNKDS